MTSCSRQCASLYALVASRLPEKLSRSTSDELQSQHSNLVMEVFEKSQTVDPEVRAYVYSLVSAVTIRSTSATRDC